MDTQNPATEPDPRDEPASIDRPSVSSSRSRSRQKIEARVSSLKTIRSINDDAKNLPLDEPIPLSKKGRSTLIFLLACTAILPVLGLPTLFRTMRNRRLVDQEQAASVAARKPSRNVSTPPNDPHRPIDRIYDDLFSPDPNIRERGVKEIVRTPEFRSGGGTARLCVSAVLAALKDENAQVRLTAAREIGEIKSAWNLWQATPFDIPPTVSELSRMLNREKDPRAAMEAALTLADFLPSKESVAALKSRLTDRNPRSRTAAAIALTGIGEGESAIEALADAWDFDRRSWHCDGRRADRIFLRMGTRVGSYPEPGIAQRKKTILEGLRHPERKVRLACAKGLAAIVDLDRDGPSVIDALSSLAESARTPDASAALDELRRLAQDPENEEAQTALKRLTRSRASSEFRRRAGEIHPKGDP